MLAVAASAACGGSGSDASPNGAAATAAATATPTPDLEGLFHGWVYPIVGACLPEGDAEMPNAPREYRQGIHEGIDFYVLDNCTPIETGTPVRAAKDGTVIRADHDYHDLTQAELDEASTRIVNGGANDAWVLDLFRGRQVWVDHGDGVVTRYAHLSGVREGLAAGTPVVQGEVIAYVGDSGTPESISSPGQETHLHWELRLDAGFLGQGLAPSEVRAQYEALFAPETSSISRSSGSLTVPPASRSGTSLTT